MGLTVNNVNTLSLLNILNKTSAKQSDSLTKLSTGFKINKGSDDPAGLIAVQSLSAELTAVDAAITNGQRANSVLDVADASLGEIGDLLSEIETLAAQSTSSGGLSAAEIAANQAQIDNAIDAINRIVQTTTFNGKRLLDGQQGIRATASSPTLVTDVKLYSRPTSNSSQSFAVNVESAGTVASATLATLTSISAAEFTVTGTAGTATITVAASDAITDIRDKIIAAASETGVSASVSGSELHIQSREYGTNAFVGSTFISGDTDFAGGVQQTTGTDAQVTVNGQQAFVDGLRVSFNSNGSSGEFSLTAAGNTTSGSVGTLNIAGGGLTFQLGTASNTQATVGVNSIFAHELGDSSNGFLSELKSGGANDLSTNANNAVLIAKSAINQVATQRGRIGGFQKFQVETSINSLNATKISLESARGLINDVDFAVETAELSRQNVLLQSSISLLGVAGQQSSQILALLG
ncbi:MAG TPA: flagellin [Phycisphaerae bacterium]|nr:flagellin [Phycisphaerae bacterium]HRW53339.1 flagellin [Phycisphaerae bacterium]